MGIGVVQTKYGKLAGVEATEEKYKGITYFKGIRYAASPEGENRWKAPRDPEPWEGVKVCDTYAPRSMQRHTVFSGWEPYCGDFYDGEVIREMSEDSLFLNVTTGAQSAGEKRPVFMWFHGGGLSAGYSYERVFENSELARKGVVVVTVAQRLNILGYFALPQLAQEQGGTCGNYGLMDEVKALDWVYENIAAFGGDPENITIGGQSGGTQKTGMLAGSPMQKGRIKRVINQSNLFWTGWMIRPLEDAMETGRKYLASAGIDPDISLEELRAMPYEKLLSGDMKLSMEMVCADGIYFKYPEPYKNIDEFACDCDYISGGNYGEVELEPDKLLFEGHKLTTETYYRYAKAQLKDLYEKYDFEKNFPVTEDNVDRIGRWYAALGLTSWHGLCVNRYFGEYRQKHGMRGRTYAYLFSHIPPEAPEDRGTMRAADLQLAWHSVEMWYTFASLRRSEDGKHNMPPIRPWTEYDVKLADMVSDYWVNFMKTGDPNGEGLPYWPLTTENDGWLEIGDEVKTHEGMDSLMEQMLYENMLENRGFKNMDMSCSMP